jgi:3-oxoacyl-[acyl-carrier protein] reductase
MNLGISGKIARVVGGSRGIGRAISEALAAEGCAVSIVARTKASIDDGAACDGGLSNCAL